MAFSLSHHIRCPVCLNDLRDPVCLPCEHSYCRVCITQHWVTSTANSKCPECRRPYTREDIRVHRALKNIVNAAREHLKVHQGLRDIKTSAPSRPVSQKSKVQLKCAQHHEDLKLFCVTDQKMVCFICKEEQQHKGHQFRTLEDAFQTKKEKTSETLETLQSDEKQLVSLFHRQAEEILNTRVKSRVLSDQMFVQFEQLHQFLRDKEAEVKKMLSDEEDDILAVMETNIFTIEEMLSDVRENQAILMSALETNTKHCEFLQWWNENGRSVIRNTSAVSLQDIYVRLDNMFLGPYETHLQFFVWKQMLKSIQTVPHPDTLLNGDDQKVSPNGFYVQPKTPGKLMKNQSNPTWLRTETSFTTGQQYWEVDVTGKLEWGVGICSCNLGKMVKDTVLCLSQSGYDIQQTHDADQRTVQNASGLKKVGVYLDCERKQVSFYNADSMTFIDIRVLSQAEPYSLCLSPGLYLRGLNTDPMRVCVF